MSHSLGSSHRIFNLKMHVGFDACVGIEQDGFRHFDCFPGAAYGFPVFLTNKEGDAASYGRVEELVPFTEGVRHSDGDFVPKNLRSGNRVPVFVDDFHLYKHIDGFVFEPVMGKNPEAKY